MLRHHLRFLRQIGQIKLEDKRKWQKEAHLIYHQPKAERPPVDSGETRRTIAISNYDAESKNIKAGINAHTAPRKNQWRTCKKLILRANKTRNVTAESSPAPMSLLLKSALRKDCPTETHRSSANRQRQPEGGHSAEGINVGRYSHQQYARPLCRPVWRLRKRPCVKRKPTAKPFTIT